MLDGFRPAIDVDHKDLIVDELGGFRSLYLQIKCATLLSRGRVHCFARYFPNAIPADPRFAYVFCFLDRKNMDLTKIWVVPSVDFNRLAYRSLERGGKIELIFSCKPDGDPKWDKYEVDKRTLGPRLLKLMKAPVKRKAPVGLDLGNVLVITGRSVQAA